MISDHALARARNDKAKFTGDDNSMSSNPFETAVILDGIRRWVEIESPTERPDQVNKLADLVASGYRDLPATVERIAGRDGCGDHLVTRSSWGQDAPGILVLSHLDTVHPMGFIERLPFTVDGDSAFLDIDTPQALSALAAIASAD